MRRDRMHPWLRVAGAAALIAAAGGLSGCANNEPVAANPAVLEIEIMRDGGVGHYHPPVGAVAVGGTVIWTNRSGVVHNVVFDDDRVPDSPLFEDGERFEAVFETAGSYRYLCTLHPAMTGRIDVS